MAEHTPGPWSVSDRYEDSSDVLDPNGFEIAGVASTAILDDYSEKLGIPHWSRMPGKSYIERSDEERLANAALIAAAPDLLAACKGAATFRLTPETTYLNARAVMDLLDAAIAKAEGRPAR